MLTDALVRLSGRIRAAAGESVLLNRFFCGETEGEGPRYSGRVRFRVMRWQETSRVRRWIARLWEGLLAATFGSLALAAFLAAAVTLFVSFAYGAGLNRPAAAVLLSCLPGLGERQSLSHCLREGRLSAPFLFGFCGLLPDRFGDGGSGCPHRFLPLLFGIPVGVAGAFLPPPALLPAALGVPVWFLLRAVPELAILALLLAFPFLPLLPHPTGILTAGAFLSLAVFGGKWISGRREIRFCSADRCAAAFCMAYLLAGRAAGAASALLAAGGWFAVRSLGSHWRARAAGCLICSAAVCGCMGILEYAAGRAALRWVDLSRFSDIGGRVCATFGNPNILAVFLLAAFPVALCGAGRFRRRAARLWSGIGAGCIALCTVLTWSRGAWLGMLAEGVLFLLLFSRESMAALICLPLPSAACLPLLPGNVLRRFASIADPAESSVRYRLEVWRGVLRMAAANPFGVGVPEADFRRAWQLFALPGTETVMHAHALLPQVALETGMAGAAVLAIFLLCTVRAFRPSGWSVGGLAALTGLLVMGLFDHIWYARGMLWLFFAVAALVPAGKEGESHEDTLEWD